MLRPTKSPRTAPRRAAAPATPGGARSPLRLAVGRGGLALELDAPIPLGPVEVDELSVVLVGLSFPVDLSGGVPRFRHRRGALERLVVRGRHERLVPQLAPRLRGLLGARTPALTVAPIAGGWSIGVSDGRAALAFDALWTPRDGEARIVVASARGAGLGRPALAAALHAMDALVGRLATRRGAVVRAPGAAAAIARELLPALGARAPDAREARWGALESDVSGWKLVCDRAFAPVHLEPSVLREVELATLAEDADERLASGDLDEARSAYLALLERAPRHVELARRVAEIDLAVGGRDEAALATLVEAAPVIDAGPLGAELLAQVGDRDGARAALERGAELESFGPLAALAWLRSAELATTMDERSAALDRAVARAPALHPPRWMRFEARLDLADFRGAMADAEHLEAATRGADARHEVWRRAAEAFLARGHDARAGALFERSLRYAPDSPAALGGLGRSLLAAGRAGRALDVMARAVDLADAAHAPDWSLVVDLARGLADAAHDLPAAVARVREVPPGHPATLDARGLEARWRARLDDDAGASMAFARLRDAVETATELDGAAAARWLVEAARFEEETRGDLAAAERHLAAAVRVRPQDRVASSAFRRVAALGRAGREPARVLAPPAAVVVAPGPPRAAAEPVEATAEDEQRIVALTDRLRADPSDRVVAFELADLLARLGRDLDLFALLSGRLEDADEEERIELLPRHRAVLGRLADAARSEGRPEEAELYAAALSRIDAG